SYLCSLGCMSVSYSFEILVLCFFFFNDPATTEIYTLSLHDALPIYFGERKWLSTVKLTRLLRHRMPGPDCRRQAAAPQARVVRGDRKSTRLNSSHDQISYAVFCLKKKKKKHRITKY